MNVTWEDGMAESRLAGSRCRSGEPFVSLPLSLCLSLVCGRPDSAAIVVFLSG